MQIKFIEETNKQYSIREDGVFIKHTENEDIIINKSKVLTRISTEKTNRLVLNRKFLLLVYFKKYICFRCNSLNNIDNRIEKFKSIEICKECIKKTRKEENIRHSNRNKQIKKEYYLKNIKQILIKNKEYYDKNKILTPKKLLTNEEKLINLKKAKIKYRSNPINKIKEKEYNRAYFKNNISKHYSCKLLNISLLDFDENLYNLHKETLKLKRELWQKKNSTTKI